MQDQEVIREFLIESHENLSRLDRELVELEKRPGDTALLASIFRTIHTIKGTCGFLAFSTLERVSHHAESLLSQLRSGERSLSPELVSLILETVDAIRKVLASIEATGAEGEELFENLSERLRIAAQAKALITQAVVAPRTPAPAVAAVPDSAPQTVEKAPAEEAKSSAVADANIRVGVGLLDKLMDLVGELVLTRNQILQFNTEREDAALNATSQRLNLITTELQDGVMKTRMQPIGMVWNKLPRVVRDIAVSLGKQINVQMDGTETELDRTIIEAIKDPLVHLVRNSCDHGIESPEDRLKAGKPAGGKLSLRAWHEGGQVNIEIGDDGAGIDVPRLKNKAIESGVIRAEQAAKLSDREALNLVFQPGLSTASLVTNFSGRGVGMDVVKSHVEKIGGVIDIFSRPGEGTWVKLKIPLTLAIIPGLVITSGGERFVIPQVSLRELVRLKVDSSEKRIEYVNGVPVYRRRGNLLPIAWLNEVLGLPSVKDPEALNMVVLQAEDQQFGLMVDGINDTQEIVVKPLGKQLKSLSVYAGATIMGDGHVALILDVHGIGQRSGVLSESREQNRASAAEQKTRSAVEMQRLLLFRAGSFQRIAVPLSLVARLEEFSRESVELAGGCQVVQYRGSILPLVSLRQLLEPGLAATAADSELIQVIVFKDEDRSVGVIVDHILDVAEEFITTHQKSNRQGLLGSAIVGKLVTDFLDLGYVIRSATENWLQGSSGLLSGKRVLVAEASAFSRGLIRSSLDMAGYQVLEAANLGDAIRGLGQEVDAVVAGLNLPPDGCSALIAEMRKNPDWQAIPAIALADPAPNEEPLPSCPEGFGDCVGKFDREAMIDSLARLSAAVEPAAVPRGAGLLVEGKR